ncbi:unnamed protein product [Urochloa humidicola]
MASGLGVVVLAALLGAAAQCMATLPGMRMMTNPPAAGQWSAQPPSAAPHLDFDFYNSSCSRAEEIIRDAVRNATSVDPGLIRLAFHDCFVQGCDASILLDPTPANPRPEKLAERNLPSQRGYDVIDAAKAALEEACPGVVSCADAVQFAARDAAFFLSGGNVSRYRLPGGRLDGRVSRADEAQANLPSPSFNLSQILSLFHAKGIRTDDLIVLLGAHSVGRSHCSSFADRTAVPSDMDRDLAASLRGRCGSGSGDGGDGHGPTVPLDVVTPNTLDDQYYRNVLEKKVLFGSDASLLTTWKTARKVVENAYVHRRWDRYFERSMRKMAAIEVKTAANGEIRKNCRVVN